MTPLPTQPRPAKLQAKLQAERHQPRTYPQSGYTLIQMAIALLVIGILMGSFFHIYNLYEQNQKMAATTENVNTIVQKLHTFRQSFGVYPCPAPMNVDRSDTDYGASLPYASYLADAPGTCRDGICIELSIRTIAMVNPRVRVGAVPFRDMQLDENTTFDGYGSRIWYAVTEDMCNLATFKDSIGGINIVNENNETQIDPAGSAAFIVISSGKNYVGAYGKFGGMSSPCTATADSENCRDVSVATQVDANSTYISSFLDNAGTSTIYDDTVQFFASGAEQLWRRQSPTSENIVQLINENLGVGTTSAPAHELTLEQSTVSKNVSASDYGLIVAPNRMSGANDQSGALKVVAAGGKLNATTYCDPTNTYCFQTKDITGDPYASTGGMKCPNGKYMTGIKQGGGTNADAECSDDIAVSCPAGQVADDYVVDAGGGVKPHCTNGAFLASCPASTTTMCAAGDVTLPSASHGTYYPGPSIFTWLGRGACSSANWKCSNGTWVVNSWNVSTALCNNSSTTYSCGAGYGGNYTSFYCGGNNWSTVCPATCYNYTSTEACPTNFSGTLSYNNICSGGGSSHTKVYLSGTCTCALPATKNVYALCPAGYIRSGTAPTPPTSATASTNSWPGDINYGKVGTSTVNGACSGYTPGPYADYCACDGSDKYSSIVAAVPSCKTPKPGTRIVNGNSYDFKYDVYKTTVSVATCTPNTPTLEDAAQFNNISYFWRELPGGPIDTNKTSAGGYPIVNSTTGCSCASTGGSVSVCAKATGGGKYDFYSCKCQP